MQKHLAGLPVLAGAQYLRVIILINIVLYNTLVNFLRCHLECFS